MLPLSAFINIAVYNLKNWPLVVQHMQLCTVKHMCLG